MVQRLGGLHRVAVVATARIQGNTKARCFTGFTVNQPCNLYYQSAIASQQQTGNSNCATRLLATTTSSPFQSSRRFSEATDRKMAAPKPSKPLIKAEFVESKANPNTDVSARQRIVEDSIVSPQDDLRELVVEDVGFGNDSFNREASSSRDDPQRAPSSSSPPPPPRATVIQRNRRPRQPRAASPWSSRYYSPPSRRRYRQRSNESDPYSSILTPVESVYIAQSINLEKVFQNVFPERRPRVKFPKTNYFVVRLGSPRRPRYVAVFGYGSVVFFDIAPKDIESWLREIRQYCTDVAPAGMERREVFQVEIQPHLQGVAHVVNGDLCVVPALDMDCVAVISNIMAQTVALDAYSRTVENLLQSFSNINSKVTQSGSFPTLDKNSLFRSVAQNNSIVIDLISKLGIKDRSDTAWNLTQYEQVHSGLKEEFEIENRFDLIEFKLNLIQQNAKFFLEVLNHQKSNTVEWIIVVLIAFECGLMILGMIGYA